MKFSIISLITTVLLSAVACAQSLSVKMSNTGICHAPGSTYYEQTKKFTAFKSLQECLNAGGSMPKR